MQPLLLTFTLLLTMTRVALGAGPAAGTCIFGAVSGINFGTYSPVSSELSTNSGTVTVQCTPAGKNFGYALYFSTGKSNTFSNSYLNSSPVFTYNLYSAPSYTTVLGNGTSNTVVYYVNDIKGKGYSVDWSVYGYLPIAQAISAGTYSDTIILTVAYCNQIQPPYCPP